MSKGKKRIALGGFFQELGKTFMLPVALMAFMGLLLGLGSSFSSPTTIDAFPFLGNSILQVVFKYMSAIGGFAFNNLAVMFAMAIPLGLAKKEKGVAAFSGFVGYMVMNLAINFYLGLTNQLADADAMQKAGQSLVLGVQTIEMGVLGGIITGIIVYNLNKKYCTIQLPDSFAFFGGARFVPIITSLVMAVVGIILPIIWPIFAFLINGVGALIHGAGPFGPMLFFSGERLLLPFGLHHILVATIRFTQAGGTMLIDGHQVSGALNIFYSELQNHLPISHSATQFLSQGKMPTFMFGLPGAALAMYHTAKPENRAKIKGLLISGFIATFITGITEPIEFLFLFISPFLWLFHVFMTGFGALVVSLLGVNIGNTDGGVLDFLIFGVMQGTQTKWYLIPIVGIFWFLAYYFTFKKFILWRDLKTPGREVATEPEYTDAEIRTSGNAGGYDIPGILKALGGKSNIVTLDNCITRLRLIVKDGSIINDEELQKLGALGVVHLDDTSVQVIIGTKVTTVRNGLDALLEGAEPEAKKFQIGAPLAGKAVPLTEVPDAVFSTGMIGQGAAIQPTDGQVVSPVDGVVTTVFPTKHAIGIKATNGMEILIHLGIDTVKLDGKPFETKVAVDEQVKVGDLLATADWQMVADAGLATVTPVVVTNFAEYTNVGMITKGMVEKNTPIIEVESA
ncbi:maltose/glucose-specific PTS transporter subunit IIBC [Pediococcus acidilactici]|uniref:maltose/glucose-specific PTS transporter subunit IIBC n=1 Tax=Pediococcus acidilactici TaxID=1254 RepID=UPI000FE35AC4|nr:maltose/glucose-specific PTS transporter subunit IIBC [Pediococcus acidilactici]KAF0372859.1 PTS maltose transporter subunit IICB [Pediococcus acidilactici]KAF0383273.1 PTS maltose transporter subunit IICB [Pediococcus acidilactici]KAF0457319.1 PTS maltose transporter subunit IICB [Pediococcus acidilactici]KAF0476549.1 PTS maltose transporter subunit IICB [Pediococcus acidilactici]KAF0537068.1 PTS maltose transporter subunit IICB [Pediococcus acidilactici]